MDLSQRDYQEIHNLVMRYVISTDNADVEGFMECWVGKDEFGGYESGPFGTMETWDQLREFEAHHVGEGGMANGKRHQVTNLMIEPINENEVHVTHDMMVIETAQIPMIIATGRYNKSLVVKTAGGWKFKSRNLEVDSGFFKLMEAHKVNTKYKRVTMKSKLYNIITIILGIILLSSGFNKFFDLFPMGLPNEAMEVINRIISVKWIWPLVAVAEIIGGVLLIIKKTKNVGAMIVLPVIVGILCFHIIWAPSGIPMALLFLGIEIWIVMRNKDRFIQLID